MTKQKKGILFIGILLFAAIITLITYNPKSPGKKHPGTFYPQSFTEVTVKTFQNNEHWGYKIFIDTTLFIYQEYLPGLPGQQTFKTEQHALECGNIVRQKILKREIPSISTTELDRLGISYTPK